ncbi:MAG: hypothetical protein PHG88_07880 [Limnochordia bacterium]|nr:hypothetical protein [Limnochordia bacterium]
MVLGLHPRQNGQKLAELLRPLPGTELDLPRTVDNAPLVRQVLA